MHVVKNSKVPDLATRYIDMAISRNIQQHLLNPPFYFVPTNGNVKMDGEIAKIAPSVGELLSNGIILDWPTIIKRRPEYIERFNKEISL
jgi:putative spermidine/putrescine transport system substrate-binding protein